MICKVRRKKRDRSSDLHICYSLLCDANWSFLACEQAPRWGKGANDKLGERSDHGIRIALAGKSMRSLGIYILLYIFKFNLVPRILRLLGQRVVTGRGSGATEKIAFFGWLQICFCIFDFIIELALQISYH